MRKKLLIKGLITVSVLLNLICLGVIAGSIYKRYQYDLDKRAIQESLSPEARHLVARTMQANRKDVREVMRRAKDYQDELVQILEAENFDKGAFEKTTEKLKAAQQKAADLKIDTMRIMAEQLPPEERAKLAKRLAGMFDKRRHHKGHHAIDEKKKRIKPEAASE